jgi:hypothetical protein
VEQHVVGRGRPKERGEQFGNACGVHGKSL